MPPTPPSLCVVGSSNVDLTFRTCRLPRTGETIFGDAFHVDYGGKGANQAVIAAKIGARVTIVTKLGRDFFARQIRYNFGVNGIDRTYVLEDKGHSTGVAAIFVDDQAQNCIIVIPGANRNLVPEEVRQSSSAIQAAKVVLCQLEIPLETTLEAFRIAKAAGVRTVLNPAPAISLPDELLQLTDYCIPNETEIELLTGQAAGTVEKAETAARTLLQRGPRTVIVTLGEQGVLVVTSEKAEHFPAVPVEAVDTTGAGDAFIGTFGYLLAEGMPLAESVRRANALAALSVTQLGTQLAFPTRATAEAFLRKWL